MVVVLLSAVLHWIIVIPIEIPTRPLNGSLKQKVVLPEPAPAPVESTSARSSGGIGRVRQKLRQPPNNTKGSSKMPALLLYSSIKPLNILQHRPKKNSTFYRAPGKNDAAGAETATPSTLRHYFLFMLQPSGLSINRIPFSLSFFLSSVTAAFFGIGVC